MQAFLSWLGFEQTQDADPDEDPAEALNLQQALGLSSWPSAPGISASSTFTSSRLPPQLLQCTCSCIPHEPLQTLAFGLTNKDSQAALSFGMPLVVCYHTMSGHLQLVQRLGA